MSTEPTMFTFPVTMHISATISAIHQGEARLTVEKVLASAMGCTAPADNGVSVTTHRFDIADLESARRTGLRKFLIEGSRDGDMFAETVEAQSMQEAEAFAIERLCEAWGETYGPDTELSDLGDAANVREYDADDYARDAAPELYEAALKAEALLTALNAQTYVEPGALRLLRDAISKARGEA